MRSRKEVGVNALSSNIAEIFYWLVLLSFTNCAVYFRFNRTADSCTKHGNVAIAYLPNLFIAGVILFVGYILKDCAVLSRD